MLTQRALSKGVREMFGHFFIPNINFMFLYIFFKEIFVFFWGDVRSLIGSKPNVSYVC